MKITKRTVTTLTKELSKFQKTIETKNKLTVADQKKLVVTLRKVYKFADSNLNESTNLRARTGLQSLKEMSLFAIDSLDVKQGIPWKIIGKIIKIIIDIITVICYFFC